MTCMHQTPPAVASLIVLSVKKCTKMLRQWLRLIMYDMMSNYFTLHCSLPAQIEQVWSGL